MVKRWYNRNHTSSLSMLEGSAFLKMARMFQLFINCIEVTLWNCSCMLRMHCTKCMSSLISIFLTRVFTALFSWMNKDEQYHRWLDECVDWARWMNGWMCVISSALWFEWTRWTMQWMAWMNKMKNAMNGLMYVTSVVLWVMCELSGPDESVNGLLDLCVCGACCSLKKKNQGGTMRWTTWCILYLLLFEWNGQNGWMSG